MNRFLFILLISFAGKTSYGTTVEEAKRVFLEIVDAIEESGVYQGYVDNFVKRYNGTPAPMKIEQFAIQLTQAPNSVGYHNARFLKLWFRATKPGTNLNRLLVHHGIEINSLAIDEIKQIQRVVLSEIDKPVLKQKIPTNVILDLGDDVAAALRSPLSQLDLMHRRLLLQQFSVYQKSLYENGQTSKLFTYDFGFGSGELKIPKKIFRIKGVGVVGLVFAASDFFLELRPYKNKKSSYSDTEILDKPELAVSDTEILEMFLPALAETEPEKFREYFFRLQETLCILNEMNGKS